AEVDLMAENINNAIAALEKKPKPSNEKPEEKTEQKTDTKVNNIKKAQTKSPETGSSALAVSALSITAGVFIISRKKRKN
ncbi:LPXTG cell wall anchor domain-containing protein, partial [Eubacterium sp.]|uniref:LPXTG cell wall anchor domain-containing protein n=1 Tax=Eubacterium sp. TaxID=142586 RepID=UPI0039917BC0